MKAPKGLTDYTNTSQQQLLRLLEVFGQAPLTAHTLANLVATLGDASRNQVFRTLQNLQQAGWVYQDSGGSWQLTAKLTRFSEQLRIGIADLHRHYLDAAYETSH